MKFGKTLGNKLEVGFCVDRLLVVRMTVLVSNSEVVMSLILLDVNFFRTRRLYETTFLKLRHNFKIDVLINRYIYRLYLGLLC